MSNNGLHLISGRETTDHSLAFTDGLAQPVTAGLMYRANSFVYYDPQDVNGTLRAWGAYDLVTGEPHLVRGDDDHRGELLDPDDAGLAGRPAFDLTRWGSNYGSYYRVATARVEDWVGLTGLTVLMVASHAPADATYSRRLFTIAPAGSWTSVNVYVALNVATSGAGGQYAFRARWDTADSHDTGSSAEASIPNVPAIYAMTFSPSSGEASLRRNGVQIVELDSVPVRAATGAINTGSAGGVAFGGGRYGTGPSYIGSEGRVGDIVAFSRVLELAEIQEWEAYLAEIYGISL